MDLSDGLIRSLQIDPARETLTLCLLCGDSSQGYLDLTLRYDAIEITAPEISLLCFIAWEDSAEIVEDEIELEREEAETLRFVHRILWQTGITTEREPALGERYSAERLKPEIELRFGGFDLEIALRSDRHLVRADNRIMVVRNPDQISGMEEPEPPRNLP